MHGLETLKRINEEAAMAAFINNKPDDKYKEFVAEFMTRASASLGVPKSLIFDQGELGSSTCYATIRAVQQRKEIEDVLDNLDG